MKHALVLATLILLVPLSGCIGSTNLIGDDALTPASTGTSLGNTTPTTGRAGETGSLRVYVHTPDGSPVGNASVEVANRTAMSNEKGVARFEDLSRGFHEITVTKDGLRTARVGVDILPGSEVYTEAALGKVNEGTVTAPVDEARHREVLEFEGYFDCSATYVIITGDCLTVVQNVTQQAGAPVDPGSSTNEANAFEFPLDFGWKSAVLELEWEPTSTSISSGKSISIEPTEAPADGHAARYARISGDSILRLQLDSGERHATATADDMPNPLGGEVVRARIFLLGQAHNAGDAGFLGVGAAAGERFTLYVTIFYEDKAPNDYSVKGA